VSEGRALQALDTLTGHQRIAVDAHEAVAKFILERLERLIEQHFAGLVPQGHVLVIGNKVDHLVQGDQFDAFACAGTDMAARAITTLGGWLGECSELYAVGSLGLFQGLEQCLGTHRLDKKADATGLQRLCGKLLLGSAQHHGRRRFPLAQAGGNLQAIEAWHTDIEQHHIRLEAVDQRQRLFARGGARFKDCITLELTDQTAQSLAGLGFVINDQDIHIALDSCVSLAQG